MEACNFRYFDMKYFSDLEINQLEGEKIMKYFYEYRYKNGCYVAGHNLVNMQMYSDIIVLTCKDLINDDCKITPIRLRMDEINYLKITPMEENKDE